MLYVLRNINGFICFNFQYKMMRKKNTEKKRVIQESDKAGKEC